MKGGGAVKIMTGDTTREYHQTIHKWTASCLHPLQSDVSDKMTESQTFSKSYVWPVSLPDNDIPKWVIEMIIMRDDYIEKAWSHL